MTDAGGHPGVRSLLAKFENNQNATTSPPSRGRSPVGSDASGASRRPLSKVRASFIAVDGGSQSSPMVGLRRISGHSDSPPPPARVRSFNSEDPDGSVKSLGSSAQTSNGFGGMPKAVEKVINEKNSKEIAELVAPQKNGEAITSPTNKENQPVLTSSTSTKSAALLPPKPAKAVSKRPSAVNVGKSVFAGKSAPQAPASKSSTQPRTLTSPSKPDNTRPARTGRPSAIKSGAGDSPNAPAHKPSRPSLNTAAKTSAKPTRSSTPAREAVKSAPRPSGVRSRSSNRPARPLAAPTSVSVGKQGTTATLSRKPSTLRTSAPAQKRATTPTASGVRKQASRPSPSQQGSDRPHSRVSNGSSKPVDEGFLARMMRPTASSASKAHEKLEIKSPPRGKPAQVPSRAPSKLETRSSRPVKEKTVPKKSQEERSIPTGEMTEADPEQQQQHPPDEPAEEKRHEQDTTGALGEATSQSPEPVDVEQKTPIEAPIEVQIYSPVDPAEPHLGDGEPQRLMDPIDPIEPPTETENEPLTPPPVDEHVEQPTEATIEPIAEKEVSAVSEEPVSPLGEPLGVHESEPANPSGPEAVEDNEPIHPGVSASLEGKPAEAPESAVPSTSADPVAPEADYKQNEADLDIGKLTLN